MSRQLSLADALVDGRLGSNKKLSRIHALIDWSRLEALVSGLRAGETGRPPYPALAMLKALYLQALYDLSDPGLEEALISGDEAAVYADRLYESKARRIALKARGIKDRIMHRRHRYMKALPRWMQARNRLISRRRAPVESVFSAMKRLYGKARTRCHSLTANAADFLAFATVFNLRRASAVLMA
jgi:hypothetical protein